MHRRQASHRSVDRVEAVEAGGVWNSPSILREQIS